MENKINEQTFESCANEMVDDFIQLNFKGSEYEPTIKFVEILLNRLKEKSLKSEDKTIKDILGR
jgi:hypothetical protein